MADKPFPELEELTANLFFHTSIVDALKQLQLLDVALKMYLVDVYWVANKARPAGVSFRLPAKSLEAKPLGQLLVMFRRHSDDVALLKSLKQLETDRKHIAHRALLLNLTASKKKGLLKVRQEETIRAKTIQRLAQSCSKAILAEVKRIRESVPAADRNPEWK
jgi:hypothetical protein